MHKCAALRSRLVYIAIAKCNILILCGDVGGLNFAVVEQSLVERNGLDLESIAALDLGLADEFNVFAVA